MSYDVVVTRRRPGRSVRRARSRRAAAPTCSSSRPGTGSAAASSRSPSTTAGSCSSAVRSSATRTPRTSSWSPSSGLTLVPSYVAEPGELTYVLHEGTYVGDRRWFSARRPRAAWHGSRRSSPRCAPPSTPDDPWSHPDAERLDEQSVHGLAAPHRCDPQRAPRPRGRPARAAAPGSFERTSLLALLRKCGDARRARVCTPTTSGRTCASPRARRRSRCGWPPSSAAGCGWARRSRSVKVGARRLLGRSWSTGEIVSAGAVVSAVPVGPLRDIDVEGVSDARLESLHRQRHALAAKFVAAYDRPFWRDRGQNGLTESEGILGLVLAAERGRAVLPGPAGADRRLPVDRPRVPRGGGAGRARRLVRARGADAGGDVRALVGHRPVDAGLRHPVAPRRRAPGGAAARHATSRRSTCAAPTSGWPATWRARCAPAGPPRRRRWRAGEPHGPRPGRRWRRGRGGGGCSTSWAS